MSYFPAPAILLAGTSVKPVVSDGTAQSAIPATGVGSMTIPANFAKVGTQLSLVLQGSYQTPALPGAVVVRIRLGGVLIARVDVDASILAANSTSCFLGGEV